MYTWNLRKGLHSKRTHFQGTKLSTRRWLFTLRWRILVARAQERRNKLTFCTAVWGGVDEGVGDPPKVMEDHGHGSVFRWPHFGSSIWLWLSHGNTFEKHRTNQKSSKRYLKRLKIRLKWFFFNYHKKTLFFSNRDSWCPFFELQGLAGRPEWGKTLSKWGNWNAKVGTFLCQISYVHYNGILVQNGTYVTEILHWKQSNVQRLRKQNNRQNIW